MIDTIDDTWAQWIEYEADGDDYVPIAKWGKDHWSTFAYLETRTVDYGGEIDNERMRCNPRLHRAFMNSANRLFSGNYPTRLAHGATIEPHDYWSCLEDMVAAGLIRAFYRCRYGEFFGGGQARVELTDEGRRVAGLLRAHKADSGNFGDFAHTTPPPDDAREMEE